MPSTSRSSHQLKSAFFPAPLGKNTSKLRAPLPGSLFRDWAGCINITNVLSFKPLFCSHVTFELSSINNASQTGPGEPKLFSADIFGWRSPLGLLVFLTRLCILTCHFLRGLSTLPTLPKWSCERIIKAKRAPTPIRNVFPIG